MKTVVKPERKSTQESGTGSEFLVLSHLYRMNINAFLSFGNTKQIDIIIKSKNGLAITIDVKSVRDYSSIPVNNVRVEPNHYIVVVIYKGKFHEISSLPDFYIIPSSDIEVLQRIFKKEKRLMKGKIEQYKDQWDSLLR
ncbi:hypothetical protein [Chitinophaga cymbidii]|uniref:PD(D/E)XK endonuclease domain-containing protein n=1 Tax=Chitinophaga cymbidii TaxID=1096750 RepID=A0A512RGC2_9BACT|nr:hypothetical protein [Chitinophaga cymbidii]GEP94763.1 hypothetical protein CCY01nite_10230 [Chitinophaga cymbidii]